MAINIDSLLWSKPGLNGGHICAAGTGVSVMRISICHKHGVLPERIVKNYPQLDVARVYASLAYYHANRDAMEAELKQEEEDYARSARDHHEKIAKPA